MTTVHPASPLPAPERRLTRRRSHADDHGIVGAMVRPGHEVAVVDVSAGGVLVESMRRLLPGAPVEVQLVTARTRAVVRGQVLRCAVAHVRAAAIFYRGAIGFDRHLSWFTDDDREIESLGDIENRENPENFVCPTRPTRAVATHHAL